MDFALLQGDANFYDGMILHLKDNYYINLEMLWNDGDDISSEER